MPFLVCTVVFGASKEEEVLDASMLLVVTLACGDFENSKGS